MKTAATMATAIELRSISSEKDGDRIALRGVRVRSRLSGMSQKTVVEQMFVNHEERAIEAIYTFPLPDGAAVCAFEVITGDRILTGTVEENEKAIEKYDDAIDQGHGAFMLEADRPDVFTSRVGNIKPRQAVTIRTTYVAPLQCAGERQIRIVFPTTVAPRYASSTGTDPMEALIDGDALNPPKAFHVPYGLSLELDVSLQRKIKAITSPTHSLRVLELPQGNPSHRVLLDGAVTAMDRDIVIHVDLAKEYEPTAEVARGPDGAPYIAVSFVPEVDDPAQLTEPPPSETIFVLDCSGSMQGESTHQMILAMELCLRSLSSADSFNICRFGSTFEMMSSESLRYTPETLDAALEYIDRGADLGGTEIMAPLQAILQGTPAVGQIRNIIVLTDGQVSNEPAVIALARQHRDRNRIFTFGIGTAASSFLVRGLARATRGAAEFITPRERIEDKVLRTFSRIASPIFEDVQIDWGDADVQTLAEIPPVFDGDVLTVFGRVQGTVPKSVMLKCSIGREQKHWTVALPLERDDGGIIATMWARRTIQSLGEVNDVRRLPQKQKIEDRQRQLIIDLSKQFNLVSSLTTFIAIEHRSLEERNEGRPALRRVPVMLARGWGGYAMAMAAGAGRIRSKAKGSRFALYDSVNVDTLAEVAGTMDRTIDKLADAESEISKECPIETGPTLKSTLFSLFRRRTSKSISASTSLGSAVPRNDLQLLLSLQSAEGWFEWKPDLSARLVPESKKWLEAITHAFLPEIGSLPGESQNRILHTAFALLAMSYNFAGESKLWRRANLKGLRWLASSVHMEIFVLQARLDALRNSLAAVDARVSP